VRSYVIGIGNLTLGGTGKTTLVSLLARYLIGKGAHVAILLRGHGGKFSGSARLVSDSTGTLMTPTEAGDEAVLLSQEVPGAVVLVGKNRTKSARRAETEFHTNVLLLDDSFQYWRLKKDLEILLWDASQPAPLHRLFPRGILREPLSHLCRADWIWLTRADQSSQLDLHQDVIRAAFPKAPVLLLAQEPAAAHFLPSSQPVSLELLKDKRVLAFAAVGNPHSFERVVASCGVSLVYSILFPDHYQYQVPDLHRLFQVASELGVDYILTTPKDEVLLSASLSHPQVPPAPIPILVLETKVNLLERDRSLDDIFEDIWQRCQQHVSPPASTETTPDVAT